MDIEKYLKIALDEANIAFNSGDYPIGSVLVNESGEILAQCHNQNKTNNDISAHAEILCLRKAGISQTNKDLNSKAYLFTSLEPCFGCSFFIDRTNISKIVWALTDPHKGGISKIKNQDMFQKFFQNVEFKSEPFEKLKVQSKQLMRKYFLQLGKTETADLYL